MTGMTGEDPEAGWRSWMGAVNYVPAERTAVIVFRGSRSGSANRTVLQAQLEAKGSADWVTDMQHFHASPALASYDDAVLSVGFHLAYESCRRSLSAALEEATGGERPEIIYLTGHSLGGALAQCAYLDMTMGDLAPLAEGARIACYPISAPPVLLGQESHWKLALAVDATQIFHYFCRHDAVHGGSVIRASGVARINDLMAAAASPLHLGVEVALESERDFPEAHEPDEPLLGEALNDEWTWNGEKMGVARMHIAFNEAWISLYSSWNGCFCSNYGDLMYAKLYNPGVAGAYLDIDDTIYFFPRVATLYVHLRSKVVAMRLPVCCTASPE